ncbi:hypothetical protein GMSM_31430 [Geomonas sp. Red276]
MLEFGEQGGSFALTSPVKKGVVDREPGRRQPEGSALKNAAIVAEWYTVWQAEMCTFLNDH